MRERRAAAVDSLPHQPESESHVAPGCRHCRCVCNYRNTGTAHGAFIQTYKFLQEAAYVALYFSSFVYLLSDFKPTDIFSFQKGANFEVVLRILSGTGTLRRPDDLIEGNL